MWGTMFLSILGPKFINEILAFDLTSTGLMYSIPYVVRVFTGIGFGALNDYLASSKRIRKVWVRKGGTILCKFSSYALMMMINLC